MTQDQRTLSSINLGQGLQVSEQGLGCMSVSGVYGSADDAESVRMVNHALDIGVTFLDTANIYGAGHSETLLSQVLKTRRDEVTLATKAGIVRPKNPGDPRANGDPAFIKKCLDESLQRLAQIFHQLSDGRQNPLPRDSRRPFLIPPTPKSA